MLAMLMIVYIGIAFNNVAQYYEDSTPSWEQPDEYAEYWLNYEQVNPVT